MNYMQELNFEIEKEDLGETTIRIPFNPSDIKMDTQTVNLGYVFEMLENGEINLKPDFQRSADLWSVTQKSRLIESILLGIPLPSFYFNEDELGNYEVIDGLQRLCALKDFIPTAKERLENKINSKLKLQGLEFLGDQYEKKSYDDLSREDKRRISGHKITLNIINKTTPQRVKYIIFKRVNTAGLELTTQEMRHALNQGFPADYIALLAAKNEFVNVTNNKLRTKRMEDRDFVNRFIAFYLTNDIKGLRTKYEGELDVFLNSALEDLNIVKSDSKRIEKITHDFTESMNLSYEIFNKEAFRKPNKPNEQRNPISKSVFDTISVNFAWLTDVQRNELKNRKNDFQLRFIELFEDKKFHNSVSTGTGKKPNVETRFIEVYNLIQSIIKNDNQSKD